MHDKAISDGMLAWCTVVSLLDWVLDAAIHGRQRYFMVENGAYGTLRCQNFMQYLPDVVVVNYCQYKVCLQWNHELILIWAQVELDGSEKYPTAKPTGIWTNIRGWVPRRCPGTPHCVHKGRWCASSAEQPTYSDFTDEALKNWLPEELQYDILRASRAPRAQRDRP